MSKLFQFCCTKIPFLLHVGWDLVTTKFISFKTKKYYWKNQELKTELETLEPARWSYLTLLFLLSSETWHQWTLNLFHGSSLLSGVIDPSLTSDGFYLISCLDIFPPPYLILWKSQTELVHRMRFTFYVSWQNLMNKTIARQS